MQPDIAQKRHEALSRTLQQIEKNFGKGAILRLDEETSVVQDGLSTGTLSLDLALGGFGIPRGRIVELFGPESGGKTTLALHIIASAQREGGVAAFVDAEHALDPTWARKCGVRLDQLLVSQPESGEQALDIVEMLVHSNAVDCIVVDSVAALVPRAELEGDMSQQHVGLQARMMSQSLRKLTPLVSRSRCVVVFINQIREKIGVMFGSNETTPGGRALKFYASIRIDIRRVTTIKEGEQAIGNHVRAKVVKNKVAAPFKQAEFDILFSGGISAEGDLIDLALTDGIIEKMGAWLSYGQVRLGQGRENSRQFLKDNPDLAAEIRRAVIAKRLPAALPKAPGPGTKPVVSGSDGAAAPAPREPKVAAASAQAAPTNGARGREAPKTRPVPQPKAKR